MTTILTEKKQSLDFGADSERIAAFSWWLAETLANIIDNFDKETREVCYSILENELVNLTKYGPLYGYQFQILLYGI